MKWYLPSKIYPRKVFTIRSTKISPLEINPLYSIYETKNAVMSKKMHWGNFVNFSYKQNKTFLSTATISLKCKMVCTTLGTTKQALKPSQISTKTDAHQYTHSHTISHQWYINFHIICVVFVSKSVYK